MPAVFVVPAVRAQPMTVTKYLNGKLLIDSDRDGDYDIYSMNPDGTGVTPLTMTSTHDFDGSWTADGTKIAFGANASGNYEIYTMAPDGTNIIRLTNNIADDGSPSWSPDGTKIVFKSDRYGNKEIYTMNADGSGVVRITNNVAQDEAPSWSPDGTKIAFSTNRDGNYEIYTMNPDGSNQQRLTTNFVHDYGSAWSPDSSTIAFVSDRNNSNREIFTMQRDGSAPVRITYTPDVEDTVSYSPDGTKFVTTIYPDTNYASSDVFTINTDGSGRTQLTLRGASGFDDTYTFQSWQPLPYTLITNDDGTTQAAITAGKDYATSAYAVIPNEILTLDGILGDVLVQSGGKLVGTGSSRSLLVQVGATVAPGHSPGCLSSGNLTLGGTYTVELGGKTACAEYDQLRVAGSVTLNAATLSPSVVNGFLPKDGDTFVIVDNDGADPVIGTFAGLSEGASLTAGGVTYRVSYSGGTGNDVVLTVRGSSSLPGVPNTGADTAADQSWQTLAAPLAFVVAVVLLAINRRRIGYAKN